MTEEDQTQQVDPNGSMATQSKFRKSPPGFQCGEALEEDGGVVGKSGVFFFCTFPGGEESSSDDPQRKLTFNCRDRSNGVLESEESAITNDEFEASQNATAVDPFFFNPGYTLAGRTGFQVWSGTRLMIESLLFPLLDDNDRLAAIQKELTSVSGKNILELGAGVGVVGTTLAAATSCRVVLTDLPTLVENSLLPNLKRNQEESRAGEKQSEQEPAWLRKASSNIEFEEEEDVEDVVFPTGKRGGWASIANVDWTEPLNEEVSSTSSLDWIIASDCVWLKSMLDSLLNTVDSLFKLNPAARLILSFQRRDAGDNVRFTSVNSIINNVRERGWSIDCLAWRHARQEGKTELQEVFLFEIIPA